MTSHEQSRWRLFIVLAFPVVSLMLATPWMLVRTTISPETTYRFGFVPWLILDERTRAWEFKPLGAVAAMLLTIVLAAFSVWSLRFLVKMADIRGRCQNCGYPMVVPSDRCPECGRPHPDPIVESRKTRLGRVHRPLIAGIVMLFTVPGFIAWFMLLNSVLLTITFNSIGLKELRIARVLAMLGLAYLLAGGVCLYRYGRTRQKHIADLK